MASIHSWKFEWKITFLFFQFVGLSIDAQMYLSRRQMNSHLAHSIGWGLTLTLAVQIAFRVTGSHLNPAVSFFFWSFGQLRFGHFLLYSLAQTVAAFVGAAFTFLLYFGGSSL
jgi:glycerol uptake facilitator-like aquaporin